MNWKKTQIKIEQKINAYFFKTGAGQYGEGDIFIGISAPKLRSICKKYHVLSLIKIKELLESKIHEFRSAALIILVSQFSKAKNDENKKKIVDFYLENIKCVNNWDLVDGSANQILGEYLVDKEKTQLYEFVKSKNIWERRISIISTYAFIKHCQFEHTLKISELLLNDKHDLMHKAVGWMLREVGKKDQAVLEEFLNKNAAHMPRTALRYAIERFSAQKRKHYLSIKRAQDL